MKRKVISLLLSLIVLTVFLAPQVGAEGFEYQFKSADEEGGTGGPHCKSLFMVNLDTDTVVYSMNPDERLEMASITKIMSYIIAYENIDDIYGTVITVPQSVIDELNDTGSSLAKIEAGEEFTGIQLLNMMMVPSGNDAALVLDKYVTSLNITLGSKVENLKEGQNPDQVLTFVDLMNMKAEELGCTNTHFTNAHGLHDEDHYSSARDLMKIVQYAMNVPDFPEITNKTTYELDPISDKTKERPYYPTTNKMMLQLESEYYYQYATGIKTGSHDQAGYCIAASARYDGYTYVVIALGSQMLADDGVSETGYHGEMHDARELFKWAFTKLSRKTVVTEGQLMGDIPISYAWKKDNLQLVASKNVNAILPTVVESSSIINTLEIPEKIEAPVKKGDVIGTATLKYADEVIGKVDIVASETIERSDVMMTVDHIRNVFTSKWFLVIIGLILAIIIVFIILILIYRRKQKRLKRVKRFRDM